MDEQPTNLYRHRNADGVLLYVGISLNATIRLEQHMRGAGWRGEIVTVEIEKFPSWESARMAEILAIQTENPLWNKADRPREPRSKTSPTREDCAPRRRKLDPWREEIVSGVVLTLEEATHHLRNILASRPRITDRSWGWLEVEWDGYAHDKEFLPMRKKALVLIFSRFVGIQNHLCFSPPENGLLGSYSANFLSEQEIRNELLSAAIPPKALEPVEPALKCYGEAINAIPLDIAKGSAWVRYLESWG